MNTDQKSLLLLFSTAFFFSISAAICFITHLVFSVKWLKNRDECAGSSLFMSLFSFAGTVYFAVATVFSVIGGLIISFSKNFSMLNRYLTIAIVASMCFAIVEALALIIGISANLNTECLKKDPVKSYFLASWVLIVVPIIVFSLLLLGIVFGRQWSSLGSVSSLDGIQSAQKLSYENWWQ